MPKSAPERPGGDQNYEHKDIALQVVWISAVVFIGLTLFAYVTSVFVIKYFAAHGSFSDYVAPPMAGEALEWDSEVRLQPDPFTALDEHMAEQEARSETFEVQTAEPEIYRIPVEVAIDVVLEKGLPKFPKLEEEAETP